MSTSKSNIRNVLQTKIMQKGLSDSNVRRVYFLPAPGRPDDQLIIDSILEQLMKFINQGFGISYAFRSDQLCLAISKRFHNQHQYIGQRIRTLIKNGDLPIKKVGSRSDKRVLYAFVVFA